MLYHSCVHVSAVFCLMATILSLTACFLSTRDDIYLAEEPGYPTSPKNPKYHPEPPPNYSHVKPQLEKPADGVCPVPIHMPMDNMSRARAQAMPRRMDVVCSLVWTLCS